MLVDVVTGTNHVFNEWSFNDTKYKVTGILKKTGKMKSIFTRSFPGLFLNYSIIKSKELNKLESYTPVTWTTYEDDNFRFAMDLKITSAHQQLIDDYLITCALDSYLAFIRNEHWLPYVKECHLKDKILLYARAR
jgi:hypothetical protein